jgi:branched-chain amino acid transport system permease protein
VGQFLQQILNGIHLGSIYALIALGYTMVYGVLRLINFAHGDVYMVGAYLGLVLAAWLSAASHPGAGSAVLVMLGSMAGCAILGLTIERFAYRPLRRAPRLTALITAIGVSLLLEGLVQHPRLFGPDPRYFPPEMSASRPLIHTTSISLQSNDAIITGASLGLMALLWYIVTRTKMGKAMRAVSYDGEAALLMGINTDHVIAFTFALGSALAGAAGFLYPALEHTRVDPLMGILPGLKAFVAAVLGGIGSIPGAMVGGLIMGIAEYAVVGVGLSDWRDAIAFVILILILLVRPAGIFGRAVPEKV